MSTDDGIKAAPSDGIKAARRADAEAALAIFTKRLNRITAALSVLEDVADTAQYTGTSAALMEALEDCAKAKDDLDGLIRNLSLYLVMERDQPRYQVAANARITTMTLSRWTKRAEAEMTPNQGYLDLDDGHPYYG